MSSAASRHPAATAPTETHPDQERALRCTTKNPRAAEIILDSVNDGVFTVDLEGHITAFNRAAEQITGVPRKEALGQPCCDVFRASICESACAMKETQATGRPVVNRAVYIIGPEGTKIPISISTALLRDSDGTMIGGVETFRDLTLVEELRKQIEGRYSFGDIIGRSAAHAVAVRHHRNGGHQREHGGSGG